MKSVLFLLFVNHLAYGIPLKKCWSKPAIFPTEVNVLDSWHEGANIFIEITTTDDDVEEKATIVDIKLRRPFPSTASFLSWTSDLIEVIDKKLLKLDVKEIAKENNLISFSFVIDGLENVDDERLIAYVSVTREVPCNEIENENINNFQNDQIGNKEELKVGSASDVEAIMTDVIDPDLLPDFPNPLEFDEFTGDDDCPLVPNIPGEQGIYTKNNLWSEGDGGFVFEAFVNLPMLTVNAWTMKLVFSDYVTEIRIWNAEATQELSQDGIVWYLTPLSYNVRADNLQFNMHMKIKTEKIPTVWLYLCNDGARPSHEIIVPPWDFEKVTKLENTEEAEMDFIFREKEIDSLDEVEFMEANKRENIEVEDEEVVDYLGQKVTLLNTIEYPETNPFCQQHSTEVTNFKIKKENSIINCQQSPASDDLKYDYNVLICMSLMFYDAQRSGVLPEDFRIPWRGNASLHDGCFSADGSEPNLSGGWFDSGYNSKFGFPMASAVTVLAWGMIEFRSSYEDANEWENALMTLKWATDYFISAHTEDNVLWGQVTPFNPGLEDIIKTRPEEDQWLRMAYKIDEEHPGSDLAGETAAALAASSIVFREYDAEYADVLLFHAHTLYQFADKYRGFYHDTIEAVKDNYFSFGDYTDEIVWGCIWVARALQDTNLLLDCQSKYKEFNLNSQNPYEFSWALKTPGINVLLAQFTEHEFYIDKVSSFFEHTLSFDQTPGGLTFVLKHGANRYAANLASIALMAAKTISNLPNKDDYVDYAQRQIHAMLGDGDGGRSYVIGFGNNYPKRYIHLASACPLSKDNSTEVLPCQQRYLYDDDGNRNILFGGLVGGPINIRGHYIDSPDNIEGNSVALDYNAGFQTAVAGLKYFAMKNKRNE